MWMSASFKPTKEAWQENDFLAIRPSARLLTVDEGKDVIKESFCNQDACPKMRISPTCRGSAWKAGNHCRSVQRLAQNPIRDLWFLTNCDNPGATAAAWRRGKATGTVASSQGPCNAQPLSYDSAMRGFLCTCQLGAASSSVRSQHASSSGATRSWMPGSGFTTRTSCRGRGPAD